MTVTTLKDATHHSTCHSIYRSTKVQTRTQSKPYILGTILSNSNLRRMPAITIAAVTRPMLANKAR